jgi:hypothetical protein
VARPEMLKELRRETTLAFLGLPEGGTELESRVHRQVVLGAYHL